MAVVYNTTGSTTAGDDGASGVSSATLSATLAAGASLLVGVAIAGGGGNVTGITVTVTYNGVSMTSLQRQGPSSNTAAQEVFGLLNCGDGAAHNIAVSTSANCGIGVGFVSATGVTAFNGVTSTFALQQNSPSLSVNTSSGDLVVGFGAHGDTISAGTPTQRYIAAIPNNTTAGSNVSGVTGTGSVTVSPAWTAVNSDHWTVIGVNMSGGPPDPGFDLGSLRPPGMLSPAGQLAPIVGITESAVVPATNVPAEVAAGTGVASDASVAVAVNAGVASGTGAALQPSVSTQTQTNAPAGDAAGTGAAFNASVSVKPNAGAAAASGSAPSASVSVKVNAGVAAATGTANGPVPGAPTVLRPTSPFGYSSTIALTWTAPQWSVTDYVVQYSSDDGSSWTTYSDGTSSSTGATLTGLTNYTRYTFRVAAVNSNGQGPWTVAEWGSSPWADSAAQTTPTGTTITTANWGLARVDKRSIGSSNFRRAWTGAGVRIYHIDSGVRATHDELDTGRGGGTTVDAHVVTAADDGSHSAFAYGQAHGTWTASQAVGATLGVAPGADLYVIKAWVDDAWTTSDPEAAFQWVIDNHPANTPAILTSSTVYSESETGNKPSNINPKITTLIGMGITCVQCTGNTFSEPIDPLSAQTGLIHVGATNSDDSVASYTLFADPRVDIFAPGTNTTLADTASDTATTTGATGTSFATPLVAGALALWKSANTGLTPWQLDDLVKATATQGAITGDLHGNPNRLLYVLADVPPAAGTNAPAGAASGTASAPQPSVSVKVNAGVAAATGTAAQPTAAAAVNATVAAGTGTSPAGHTHIRVFPPLTGGNAFAYDPTASVKVNAGVAAGTGAALNPTVSTSGGTNATAGVASGTGAAGAATVAVSVNAGVAAGTGTAGAGTASDGAGSGAATGTVTAPSSTPSVKPNAGVASGTGAAFNATVSTQAQTNANAGVAAGTGTAAAPSISVKVNAGVAAGTGAAFNATVSTQAQTNAPAGVAAGTGAALGASISIKANAGVAAGIGAAPTAAVNRTPFPGPAGATGAAMAAAVQIKAAAGVAAGIGAALDPVITGGGQVLPDTPDERWWHATLEDRWWHALPEDRWWHAPADDRTWEPV